MANDYSYMDEWESEQVAAFKEEASDADAATAEAISLRKETVSAGKKIVAEGDSWFDYLPGTDIIDCLRRHHDYSIKNYAKAGDTLENMIYGTEINDRFQRVSPSIERVVKRIEKIKPKVFLFSGGGNDIAGEEFESYLNHKTSGLPALREDFINNMVNVVFRKYLVDLIDKVEIISPATTIVVHGYGHTRPTGKGVEFLFFKFAGPWLLPALAKKGVFDVTEQRQAVELMINKYNQLLSDLDAEHPNFIHVDLREDIDPDNDWSNELHLKNSVFARVADRIHGVISSL